MTPRRAQPGTGVPLSVAWQPILRTPQATRGLP